MSGSHYLIMKNLFIVANWKSNKTGAETNHWFQEISNLNVQVSNKQIIVCPSFAGLEIAHGLIKEKQLPIKLGAQDISAFDEGSHTGEVNGKQIVEFGSYVIIGHSERRQSLGESQELLDKKVGMANKYKLSIIYCVQDENMPIPAGVSVIAYEPISAIGTDNPDSPENANEVARKIKQNFSNVKYILYGGSVNGENVCITKVVLPKKKRGWQLKCITHLVLDETYQK